MTAAVPPSISCERWYISQRDEQGDKEKLSTDAKKLKLKRLQNEVSSMRNHHPSSVVEQQQQQQQISKTNDWQGIRRQSRQRNERRMCVRTVSILLFYCWQIISQSISASSVFSIVGVVITVVVSIEVVVAVDGARYDTSSSDENIRNRIISFPLQRRRRHRHQQQLQNQYQYQRSSARQQHSVSMSNVTTSWTTRLSASFSNAAAAVGENNNFSSLLYRQQRRQRRHQIVQRDLRSSFSSASLFLGEGTHFVDLWVGTPPQRQTLIVDTGSDVTAFPCYPDCHGEGCDGRENYMFVDDGVEDEEAAEETQSKRRRSQKRRADRFRVDDTHHRLDSLFNTTDSRTFRYLKCKEVEGEDNFKEIIGCMKGTCHPKANSCHLKMTYREGSGWRAREARDYAYVGGHHDKALLLDINGHESAKVVGDDDDDGLDPSFARYFRFPLIFGCQTSLKGAFATQREGGILGMENNPKTLWRQMYEQGAIAQPGFSLCFGRTLHMHDRAGILTLGGYQQLLHKSSAPMVFTQGLSAVSNSNKGKEKENPYFGVLVRHIYLRNDHKIIRLEVSAKEINSNPIVVDSGATDTYLTKVVTKPFQKAWKELVAMTLTGISNENNNKAAGIDVLHSKKFNTEFGLHSIDHLPTLIIQLKGDIERNKKIVQALNDSGGRRQQQDNRTNHHHPLLAEALDPNHPYDVLVIMPPSSLYEYIPNRRKYYARFHFDPNTDSAFGSSAMFGHDIFFHQNGKLGWAKSSCDYYSLLLRKKLQQSQQKMQNYTALLRAEHQLPHDHGIRVGAIDPANELDKAKKKVITDSVKRKAESSKKVDGDDDDEDEREKGREGDDDQEHGATKEDDQKGLGAGKIRGDQGHESSSDSQDIAIESEEENQDEDDEDEEARESDEDEDKKNGQSQEHGQHLGDHVKIEDKSDDDESSGEDEDDDEDGNNDDVDEGDDDKSAAMEGNVPEFQGFNMTSVMHVLRKNREASQYNSFPVPGGGPADEISSAAKAVATQAKYMILSLYGVFFLIALLVTKQTLFSVRKRRRRVGRQGRNHIG